MNIIDSSPESACSDDEYSSYMFTESDIESPEEEKEEEDS
jgi:hypothetical protein